MTTTKTAANDSVISSVSDDVRWISLCTEKTLCLAIIPHQATPLQRSASLSVG